MKVVFLDFDGPIIPLMSHTNARGKHEKAWPPCVAALNRITDSTGAKIVVSSSWRGYGETGLAWVRGLLSEWGVTAEVIGVTPQLHAARGEEIQAWLDAEDCDSFVILDDDDDMLHLLPSLILTPFEVGLTETDADKAISFLLAGDPDKENK